MELGREKYMDGHLHTTASDGVLTVEEMIAVLWSSFFVTLLAKKNHYSVMQLPSLHVG